MAKTIYGHTNFEQPDGYGSAPLPDRDPAKPSAEQGMYLKYYVTRVDGRDGPEDKHYNCNYFVLDLDHDPAAKPAMLAYADAIEATHPLLAAGIRKGVDNT